MPFSKPKPYRARVAIELFVAASSDRVAGEQVAAFLKRIQGHAAKGSGPDGSYEYRVVSGRSAELTEVPE